MTLDNARTTVEFVAIVIGTILIAWLIWKRSLLDVQQKAMQVQSEALEAYETRIGQLEEKVDTLIGENRELRGIIEGKNAIVRDIVEAIAEANICLNAPTCGNRVVPTD